MMVAMLEYKKSPAAFMMCFFFSSSFLFLSEMIFCSCLGDFKGMNGCPSFNVGI